MTLWFLLGVVLGGAYVAVAVRAGRGRERWLLGVALAVAAVVYVPFAVAGQSGPLLVEVLGAGAFLALAHYGTHRWPLLLAAGWLAHAGWDAGLHLWGPGHGPLWYAALCLGFDPVLAAAVVVRARRLRPDTSERRVVTA
jgi:hypothetical protein